MEFKQHLTKYLSEKEITDLCDSFSDTSLRAILLNTNKTNNEEILKIYPSLKKHPVVDNAFIYNPNELPLGKSLEHFLGLFYIQEPSAMVPASLLNATEDDIVLDLCAAPGGKTIQTSFLMKNKSLIVANDISHARTGAILDNIERLGIGNVVVTNNDFKNVYNFYKNYFTKIILDAPCSGSGMFKKDDKMIEDWSYNKVLKFAEQQKEMISYAYDMLKPGGTLLYSTCSFSFEENEEVIEHLLNNSDATIVPIKDNSLFYVSKKKPLGIHLFPNIFPGDGQYICLIKKPGIIHSQTDDKIRKEIFGEYIFQVNREFKYPKQLHIVRYGLRIAQKIKNKNELIYDYHYSRYLNNFEKEFSLNDEQLDKFLKGESLNIQLDKGYYLIKHNGKSVSFAKSDGRILKNHLPKHLRRQ